MTLKLTQLSLLCRVCGTEVPPSGRRGPRRTYCSEACKQAAYRRRARGAPEDLPRQGPSGRLTLVSYLPHVPDQAPAPGAAHELVVPRQLHAARAVTADQSRG